MPHPHRHHHHVARNFDEIDASVGRFVDTIKKSKEKGKRDDVGGGGEATVIHTVYKTLEPTFEGPVAGYSTLIQNSAPEATRASGLTQGPKSTKIMVALKSSYSLEVKESSSIPTAIRQVSTTSDLDTVLAQATGDPTLSHSVGVGNQDFTPASIGTAPTSTLASESTTPGSGGNGTSAGAKAGIAFGVLGGVFIAGLVAFLLFRSRRRQAAASRMGADNEKYQKSDNTFETMTIRSDPHAPRISLRPVTQFLPNWSLDKRSSKGAGAALVPAAAMDSNGLNNGLRDRPATSQSIHPANPFGNHAERIQEPTIPEHGADPLSDPFTANGPVIAAGAAGAATIAAACALARKTSMRKDRPGNLDLTVPSALAPMPSHPIDAQSNMKVTPITPDSTVPQSNGAAAIAAAGVLHSSNVHRVQLDFKPSLEDEMEMKAGELVRLLHEYDDGWALCIRIDRSQQGVVPRTCLSTRPVKPRSPEGGPRPGPPVNPNGQFPRGPPQRPMTPQGRPMTPQNMPQGRPRMSPGEPGSPGPRPMSPSGRAQSPGPRHSGPHPESPGSRPDSTMGAPQPIGHPPGAPPTRQAESPSRGSPGGPSSGAVGRKPVPGQAF